MQGVESKQRGASRVDKGTRLEPRGISWAGRNAHALQHRVRQKLVTEGRWVAILLV